MKRSAPMKRSKPLRNKKPMRQRSAKMERKYAGDAKTEGRRAFTARILRERPKCEVCPAIAEWVRKNGTGREAVRIPPLQPPFRHDSEARAFVRCAFKSQQVHEKLMRSAGGSITDDANVLALCKRGHRWLHNHPAAARELGFIVSRFGRV